MTNKPKKKYVKYGLNGSVYVQEPHIISPCPMSKLYGNSISICARLIINQIMLLIKLHARFQKGLFSFHKLSTKKNTPNPIKIKYCTYHIFFSPFIPQV